MQASRTLSALHVVQTSQQLVEDFVKRFKMWLGMYPSDHQWWQICSSGYRTLPEMLSGKEDKEWVDVDGSVVVVTAQPI